MSLPHYSSWLIGSFVPFGFLLNPSLQGVGVSFLSGDKTSKAMDMSMTCSPSSVEAQPSQPSTPSTQAICFFCLVVLGSLPITV